MVEQQTIKYAPQLNNMTVDNVTFQTNNVVGNFNYPPNVPAYKPIMKFLLNCPLKKAFTNCPSVVYQNFLREFWSTAVAYDPFPSTNETEQRPLKEFLIKFSVLGRNYSSTEQVNFIQQLLAYCLIIGTEVDIGEIIYNDLVTKLLNKSRLKYVSYPRFISCALEVLLGSDYTQDENFGFLPGILSNSNFTKDPSKVTDIELTAYMIVGPEIPGTLSKKSKRPKSKKPPTETKVTPPKPTEGFEQSHSVSSGTVPDPQDLERNIQLASTGLLSTLDEGTRKSQPLLESTATHPKDLGGNIQPLDRDLTSTTSGEGTTKTTSRPEGSLGDKDLGGNIPPTDMEPIHPTVTDLSRVGAKYQVDQTHSTRLRSFLLYDDKAQKSEKDILGDASDTDSSCDDILKKYDNILPLVECQLVKYLRKMSNALFAKITEDNWEKHREAVVNYADLKASIDDYYDENIAH
ncbi:hypothetical protein Tco_0009223 [Tanacetum coccineum]